LVVNSQFAKMGEPQICHLTSSWRSHQITFLNQEGLINFFQGTPVFSNSGGDGGNANGSPFKFFNDGREDFIVHLVQTMLIHIQGRQCHLGNVVGDGAVAFDLGKVADTAQQKVGDTWCATATSGDFEGRIVFDGNIENGCGAFQDFRQSFRIIVLQSQVDTETGTQWGVSKPERVVAPTKVKGLSEICTLRALGPLSIMMSMR